MDAPAPCHEGEYQPSTGQTLCLVCPAGSFCHKLALTDVGGLCPEGYYCIAGTINSMGFRCPQGSYCPLGDPLSPIICPAGSYCEGIGAAAITDFCLAGYYCPTTGFTVGNSLGYMCPRGYYCPVGTVTQTPCPIGTYGPVLGADVLTDCLACPANRICNVLGLATPLSTCPAGVYCNPDGT